jgi:hypothetical protein
MFTYACGSSYLTTPNAWVAGSFFGTTGMSNGVAAVNNFMAIANVGLYTDPNGTGIPPEFELPDHAAELARCMRYWQQVTYFQSFNCASGINYHTSMTFPVVPRSTPTLSGVNRGASSFPTAVGTLTWFGDPATVRENRAASATSTGGNYGSTITANARM